MPEINPSKNILIVIRSLNMGGAERQAVLAARELKNLGHKVDILTLKPGNEFANELDTANIRVLAPHATDTTSFFGSITRLNKTIRQEASDVLLAYMPLANILVSVSALFHQKKDITRLLGVRASNLSTAGYGFKYEVSCFVEAVCSRLADGVICNSHAGKTEIQRRRWANIPQHVIPNGMDTRHYALDSQAKRKLTESLGIPENSFMVAVPARYDPVKNHEVLIKAAGLITKQLPELQIICLGPDVDDRRNMLRKLASQQKQCPIKFLGSIKDPRPYLQGADVVCLPSLSEGFSNALAESMACGTPCIATEVGDAKFILGNTGVLVPSNDAQALADALLESSNFDFSSLATKCRQHIEENYSVTALGQRLNQVIMSQPDIDG